MKKVQLFTNSSLLSVWRKSQCDKELNSRERSETVLSLDEVQQRLEQGGSGHGHQLVLSKDSDTNNKLEDTELNLAAATHQLKQLLGDEGSPEGSKASRILPYCTKSTLRE